MHFRFPNRIAAARASVWQSKNRRKSANQILNGSYEIKMQKLKAILQVMHFLNQISSKFHVHWWLFCNTVFTECIPLAAHLNKSLFCLFILFILLFVPIQRCTIRHISLVSLFVVRWLWAKCKTENFISIMGRLSYLLLMVVHCWGYLILNRLHNEQKWIFIFLQNF